jgi:hypothetical protein
MNKWVTHFHSPWKNHYGMTRCDQCAVHYLVHGAGYILRSSWAFYRSKIYPPYVEPECLFRKLGLIFSHPISIRFFLILSFYLHLSLTNSIFFPGISDNKQFIYISYLPPPSAPTAHFVIFVFITLIMFDKIYEAPHYSVLYIILGF